MTHSSSWGLGILLLGCGGDPSVVSRATPDAGAPVTDAGVAADAATTCAPWPHDGLEPACTFDPGPGNGLTAPPDAALPKPTGACPGFAPGDGCTAQVADGSIGCTFQPAGEPPRQVAVWMPPAGQGPGPLVLYYFGLLGFPGNAVTEIAGFNPDAMKRLVAEGGMLVAPAAREDRNPVSFARLPWIDALGFDTDDGDFRLVDEIVGCAIQKVGIDVKRIHVSGLSAGGWMTTQVAVHRSSYVASIVTFSGGIEDLEGLQDPTNTFPVAMFNGGPTDHVGAHFEDEAQSGANVFRHEGHFTVVCEHGAGHSVPAAAGIAGMQFLLDHPYGTVRSPYCDSAPPELSLCDLTTPVQNGYALPALASAPEAAACTDRARTSGLAAGVFTAEMLDCSCSRCGAELAACLDDAGCLQTMQCATTSGCFGISCYQEKLCASVIDAAGGPQGASAQLAVAYSDCVGAAACDPCNVPPR